MDAPWRSKTYELLVAERLTAATGKMVTERDVSDWLGESGAGPAFKRVDRLVKQVLGTALYQNAMNAARLPDVLDAKLSGRRLCVVGGVQFDLTLKT